MMSEPSVEPTKPAKPAHQDEMQFSATELEVDHQGSVVYLRGALKEGNQKDPLVIIPDFYTHTAALKQTAEAICEQGQNCYYFDLRGFGRSGLRLGHVESYQLWIKDLLQVSAWIRKNNSGKIPMLMGFGFGGLILANFCVKFHAYANKAIIFNMPAVSGSEIFFPKRFFVNICAELVPQLKLPSSFLPPVGRVRRVLIKKDTKKIKKQNRLYSAKFMSECRLLLKMGRRRLLRLKPAHMLIYDQKTFNRYKKEIELVMNRRKDTEPLNLQLIDLPIELVRGPIQTVLVNILLEHYEKQVQNK